MTDDVKPVCKPQPIWSGVVKIISQLKKSENATAVSFVKFYPLTLYKIITPHPFPTTKSAHTVADIETLRGVQIGSI